MTTTAGTYTYLLLASLLALGCLQSARCDTSIYKYKDETGRTYYVDDPGKIPERFRTKDLAPHKLPEIIRTPASPGGKPKVIKRMERLIPSFGSLRDDDFSSDEFDVGEMSEGKNSFGSALERRRQLEERIAGKIGMPLLIGIVVCCAVLALITLVATWILLERAGMPGYGTLIPLYNAILFSRLGGYSGWWILWWFIPGIGGTIWAFTVHYGVAKNFGRSTSFAIATMFFPFICLPIMAFSKE